MSLSAALTTAALTTAVSTASRSATGSFFERLLHGSSFASKVELVGLAFVVVFCIVSVVLFIKLFKRVFNIEKSVIANAAATTSVENELVHCVRKDELTMFGLKLAQDYTKLVTDIQKSVAEIHGAMNLPICKNK